MTPSEVLSFWFEGDQKELYRKKWFCSGRADLKSIDAKIHFQFGGDAHASCVDGSYDLWMMDSPRSAVALIVVVDQFSRHIFRHLELPGDDDRRRVADSKALELAVELTSRPGWDATLSIGEKVFALMPFRHNASVERLKYVMSSIDKNGTELEWGVELLSRFRKQTLRRLQTLEDQTAAMNADSILEREAFDADECDLMMNPLVVAVDAFLRKVVTNDNDDRTTAAPVAISLSGGVDSMVICKILAALDLPGGVIAIHIDYANRDESSEEALYVEGYCKKLAIKFHKRVIDEVTRGVTDRSEYEIVSREARYDFYKHVMAETGCRGVIFGHHQGDVQENVLSNIMRGCSPLALSGMESVGITNNVPVWRPLLSFDKSAIFEFAHKYGVPYFRDTTPTWSTRGKLRNQLVPLLVDMYGQGCLNNLANLAVGSDQNRKLLMNNLYKPFLDTVQRDVGGVTVNIKPFRHQPHTFWKEALKELMHSLSLSLVRDKAVSIFMERVQPHANDCQALRGPFGWLELKKNFSVYLSNDGFLTIFLPQTFVDNSELLDNNGKDYKTVSLVANGDDNAVLKEVLSHVRVGCWDIHFQWLDHADGQERILENPGSLISGSFRYTLPVVPGCCELVFFQSRKSGRKSSVGKPPSALTGIDLRVRNALPLLIPNISSDDADDTDASLTRYLSLTYTYRHA
jgi:tRNA(Ile)-lysidine synthetase-like protein